MTKEQKRIASKSKLNHPDIQKVYDKIENDPATEAQRQAIKAINPKSGVRSRKKKKL